MCSPGEHESGSGVERTPPRCSFCKKSPGDEGTLIEGPILEGSLQLYICSDCVDLCSSILEMERRRRDAGAQDDEGTIDAATREMLAEKIEQVLDVLSDREREIIKRRYGLRDGYTYTLDEVAREFEITPERVREIEAEAIAILRSHGPEPAR